MNTNAVKEGILLWQPSQELVEQANLTRYMNYLQADKGLRFDHYAELWEWSVAHIEDFWESIWKFCDIRAREPYRSVLPERRMPGARWFPGSELNYAEHVFGNDSPKHPALIFQSERHPLFEMSWHEFRRAVSSVARSLRSRGVGRGDRVVAYVPNIPEAVIAFLATASIGAIWSSCSPDFGTRSVIDRFRQIEPKVLLAVDGYQYGGKAFDRRAVVAELQRALPGLETTVLVPYLDADARVEGSGTVATWKELLADPGELLFEQVPFDHPLWVVYSSGTTGVPKALVHSHGGILLEFVKFLTLHLDVRPGDRFFWFSTTGWVMWNIVQGALLRGATALLYDGSPGYPSTEVLWDLAENAGATVFGTSAAYLTGCMNAGMSPGSSRKLGALRIVGSTGSPLPPQGFQWVYERVKEKVLLASISGGTDVCTAFIGSCPLLPVHAGELQCRCLGVKAEAFDEKGHAVLGEVGELVITEPMPSMPLYLWNDAENRKYNESYFDMYPGVWRHGDWITFTPRGSSVIHGRSDSTLKRMGVRMGSSEIYGAVEDLPEILDSLIVGLERAGGRYHMPLFVVLKEGLALNDSLRTKINEKIRTALSPRHVPDEILAVPEVPRTLNGKKLEVPVKKILMGVPTQRAVNIDSLSNPDSIAFFVDLAGKPGSSPKPEDS